MFNEASRAVWIAGMAIPMSTTNAARCGLRPLLDESFGGTSHGLGTASKHGRVHYAKVKAATGCGSSADLEVAFDVMEFPSHATFDAILGIDFLARHRALIDVCECALVVTIPTADGASSANADEGKGSQVKLRLRKED